MSLRCSAMLQQACHCRNSQKNTRLVAKYALHTCLVNEYLRLRQQHHLRILLGNDKRLPSQRKRLKRNPQLLKSRGLLSKFKRQRERLRLPSKFKRQRKRLTSRTCRHTRSCSHTFRTRVFSQFIKILTQRWTRNLLKL